MEVFWPIIAVIAAGIAIYLAWRLLVGSNGRIVQLSHLRCQKCGAEFDYAWIPFASITSVRLLTSRFFRCPVCKKWSMFNIWDTRVDPETHHCPTRIGPS